MCDICGKGFETLAYVYRHHKMTHLNDNQKCDHCGKVYKNQFRLTKHIRRSVRPVSKTSLDVAFVE